MGAVPLLAGVLLVASAASRDPDLAQSVILLVHYDQTGAIGLIVNRRSDVPLSEVYPGMKGASIQVYAGGPLAIGIRALVRSRSRPADATHLFADVYMISTKPALAKLVAAGTRNDKFRVYAGYTGWTTRQLNDEVSRGLWNVIPGDAAAVFDAQPEHLWPRLAARFQPKARPR